MECLWNGPFHMDSIVGSDVTAQLGWLMAWLRHLANQIWL